MWFTVVYLVVIPNVFFPGVFIEGLARRHRLTHFQTAKLRLWGMLSWPGYQIAKRRIEAIVAERDASLH